MPLDTATMDNQNQQGSSTTQPQDTTSLADRPRRTRLTSLPDTKTATSDSNLPPNSVTSPSVPSPSPGPQGRRPKSHAQTMHIRDDNVDSLARVPKTTKTGRVSKAKKGLKVHSCDRCDKVYSRAEHLRRHQNNHGDSLLHCPICNKAFFRDDLLARHITKHSQPDSDAQRQSSIGGNSSRSSERFPSNPPGADPVSSAVYSTAHAVPSIEPTTADVFRASTITTTRYNQFPVNQPYGPVGTKNISSHFPTSYPTSFPTSFPMSTAPSFPMSVSAYHDDVNVPTQIPSQSKVELTDRPLFHHQPQPWIEVQGNDYVPFIVSPTSTAPTPPWLPPYNSFSSAPTLDTSFGEFTQIPPLCWPGLPTFFTPISPTPPGWDHDFMMQDKLSSHASASQSSSSPRPVLAVPPTLLPVANYSGESSLQDAHLGVSLSEWRKQTYIHAYFEHFHPLFPIIHKQTFQQHAQLSEEKLLISAIMAIGAQYAGETFAGSDSRILHEKCQELIAKNKETLSNTNRLEIMQAIVLVEFLSHFKAKRASENLSEVFIAVYDQLWHRHDNYQTKSAVDRIGTIQPLTGEEEIRHQWNEWIEVHCIERLLAASYILESTQALLLVRPNHAAAASGLHLYMPVADALWDATGSTEWARLLQSHQIPTTNVFQTLDEIECNSDVHCDPFQSALIVACYASSTSVQLQDPMGFDMTGPSHAMFEESHHALLSQALDSLPSLNIMHHAVRLVSSTPLRALIATSGESWFFSKRLAGEAHAAANEFESLKHQLRNWTNPCAASDPSSSFGITPTTTPFANALSSALEIIRLASSMPSPHTTLAFGPEIALYFASLVLWSATFAGISRAEASGQIFTQDDETAEFEPSRAGQLVQQWLPLAIVDIQTAVSTAAGGAAPLYPEVAAGTLSQNIPPNAALEAWRTGVGSVVRWTSWVLSGAGHRTSGAGELVEGAVGVLEKLGRSGWVAGWF